LVFDDIEEDLIADFCSEGPDEEYCSISEVPNDEEGYWLDILNGLEFDSTYVIDQMLIEACRSDFEGPEADLRIIFLVNADSSVRIISFDEKSQEIGFDSDTDSLDNWSLISLNDTQWAAMIADEYPYQVVEAVYKNSYEDDYESWNDIFVFFEDDCLVIFDDNDGMIWEDLCKDWFDEDHNDGDGSGSGRKELPTKSFFGKTISSTVADLKPKQFIPSIRGKKTDLIKKGVIRNKEAINSYAKRNNSNIRKVKKSQFSFLR